MAVRWLLQVQPSDAALRLVGSWRCQAVVTVSTRAVSVPPMHRQVWYLSAGQGLVKGLQFPLQQQLPPPDRQPLIPQSHQFSLLRLVQLLGGSLPAFVPEPLQSGTVRRAVRLQPKAGRHSKLPVDHQACWVRVLEQMPHLQFELAARLLASTLELHLPLQ